MDHLRPLPTPLPAGESACPAASDSPVSPALRDLPGLPLVPVLLALYDARHAPAPRAHDALTRATLGAPLRVARALLALEDAGLADARRARLTPAGTALAERLAAAPSRGTVAA